jgi:endonuclease YncB( thermonuclease family)
VRVERVLDGDSVRIGGGTPVRLIGINAPEGPRDGRPAQPLADAARTALRELLAAGPVTLQPGEDPVDRHGRLLAHLFVGGASVEAALLRRGLGFHIAVAPNLAHLDCLQRAESEARAAGVGVWSEPAYRVRRVSGLEPRQGGFARVRGRVTSVSFKRNGWWVQLDGKLALRVEGAAQAHFSRAGLRKLKGREVGARGWLVPMDGWWQMRLTHPAMLDAAGG